MEVDASTHLVFEHGVWLGVIPTPYGPMELVIDGTADAPNAEQIAAIQTFLPQAHSIIPKLHRKFSLRFLWRLIRLAPNNQNRVGVQFQHRIFNRREILFADEA